MKADIKNEELEVYNKKMKDELNMLIQYKKKYDDVSI